MERTQNPFEFHWNEAFKIVLYFVWLNPIHYFHNQHYIPVTSCQIYVRTLLITALISTKWLPEIKPFDCVTPACLEHEKKMKAVSEEGMISYRSSIYQSMLIHTKLLLTLTAVNYKLFCSPVVFHTVRFMDHKNSTQCSGYLLTQERQRSEEGGGGNHGACFSD